MLLAPSRLVSKVASGGLVSTFTRSVPTRCVSSIMEPAKSILVINSGSSSIKFAVFDSQDLSMHMSGQFSNLVPGSKPEFKVSKEVIRESPEFHDHKSALSFLLGWLDEQRGIPEIFAAGHRVVHGGACSDTAVLVDKHKLREMRSNFDLAPQHQPHNVAAIEAIRDRNPGLPQVAVFDTAFHATQPALAKALPIDFTVAERFCLKRYGFHGTSYEYIAKALREGYPDLHKKRVVVAHLGSGASLCGMVNGRSMATTMGFSTLDGLPMGTRSGSVDPGIIFHLYKEHGWSMQEIEDLLYKNSGLQGVSGISNQPRVLEDDGGPRAMFALDLFSYRVSREIASIAGALGGLDALVFTAGIGENVPSVRAKILDQLAWLGLSVDVGRNDSNSPVITTPSSKIPALVVPTREEYMIALHTANITI